MRMIFSMLSARCARLWLLLALRARRRRLRRGRRRAADGRARVVATTTQAADLVRNVGGAHVEVTQHPRARTPTRTTTRCARTTCRRSPTPTSSCAPAATSTRGWTRRSTAPARDAPVLTLSDGIGLRGRRPALVAGPAQRRAPIARSATRCEADPRAASPTPTRGATSAGSRASTARSPRASTRSRPRSASSSPRTTRSATTPRRYGIEVDRHGDPVALTEAQPSAGDTAELIRTIQRDRREGDLRRELGQPEGRGRDRARDRREGRQGAVGRLARAARAPTARRTCSRSSPTRRRWSTGFTGGAETCSL